METPGQEPRPARVLIVDDDPAIRQLCAINLQLEGHEVLEAEDGRHGLERALLERPDLVLTDVAMPRLDGFQMAEALRRSKHTREIPLIFISGETDPTHQARAEKLGALAFLAKPIELQSLAALVREALARAGSPVAA
jgi:two-component system response regulator RpaA